MEANVAVTVRIDGEGSGPDVERLHQALLANAALRRHARPEIVRREGEQGKLSGWVSTAVALAPVVMAAPAFAREVKRVVDGWFRSRPDSAPLVVTGPRGSVTVSGALTDDQFEALVGVLLPDGGESPEGDAGDADAAPAS
jgi:hypothetical protein